MGVLHAKSLCVDGRLALVGSPNCDPRSFRLNFECSLLSLDARLAGVLTDQFNADLRTCDPVIADAYAVRSTARKLGEAAAALFTPVL